MSDNQTVEQKAEMLARMAADRAAGLVRVASDRAAGLALADAEKMTERAVKDALVDRDISDHSRRLDEIDDTQRKTAKALEDLKEGMSELAAAWDKSLAITQALANSVSIQAKARFSRRQIWVMGLGALGAYAGVFVAILAQWGH
jgi:septal ring factor EnvC (AmiA/AmiB activator)